MQKPKLIRITTIPLSLEKLLEGQLGFMSKHFEVVAVSAERERLEAYGRREGVRTFFLPLTRKITPFQDLRAVWRLYRFLRKEKPLIVHTHTPKAGLVGMMAAYFARVPHRYHTVAGLPLMEARGLKRAILNSAEKSTYGFATRVYPNSKGLSDFIIAEKFAAPNKLKVIANGSSNGIDTTYFSRSHYTESELLNTRRELGIKEDHFVFLFVGRIVKDKGINELVAAFLRLHAERPNCILLLVGPYENDLDPISTATEQAIQTNEHIITTGYRPDVRPYFAISDCLVFPSYREGFPNVVLQAGAMELPALVSDINGCNEIVEHEENGLIFPVKNENAIYEAMDRLCADEALRLRIVRRSRPLTTELFERKEVWQALLREYPIP
ncbi:MAG: glycosyltransferase family 4 protein [Bacteroidota bacterium]